MLGFLAGPAASWDSNSSEVEQQVELEEVLVPGESQLDRKRAAITSIVAATTAFRPTQAAIELPASRRGEQAAINGLGRPLNL